MGKKLLKGYILIVLVFIIYVMAVIPFPKTAVFWTAFAFSLAAFLAQAYTLYTIMKSQAAIKDRIYDFPLIRISALYLAVQLLTSLLLMGFSAKIPVFAAVLVEMVILAAAVMGFFAVGAVRKEILSQDIQLKKKLAGMEELRSRVHLLISRCGEGQIRELLQKLAEEIRYSNPVSGEYSEEIEEEIAVLLEEVEAAALDGDVENTAEFCTQMKGLLRERDRICKESHKNNQYIAR